MAYKIQEQASTTGVTLMVEAEKPSTWPCPTDLHDDSSLFLMWQPHELGRDAACAVAQTSHIFLLTALNKQAAHKSTQSPLFKYFLRTISWGQHGSSNIWRKLCKHNSRQPFKEIDTSSGMNQQEAADLSIRWVYLQTHDKQLCRQDIAWCCIWDGHAVTPCPLCCCKQWPACKCTCQKRSENAYASQKPHEVHWLVPEA
jgi:hypothetical protein